LEHAVRLELTIAGFAGRCLSSLAMRALKIFGSKKKLAGLVGLKPTTCRLEAGRSHSSELQARKGNDECGMRNDELKGNRL
jgi:hypothetical protein